MPDSNCIFCQLIEGKIPAKKVYEDHTVVALLDINPANPGHLLVLPKEHVSVMPQMQNIGQLFVTVKKLSHRLLKTLKAQGTSIFIANGAAAGQKAPHFMVHIIPRFVDDKLDLTLQLKDVTTDELFKIKQQILGEIAPEPVESAINEPAQEKTDAPKDEAEVEEEKKLPQPEKVDFDALDKALKNGM